MDKISSNIHNMNSSYSNTINNSTYYSSAFNLVIQVLKNKSDKAIMWHNNDNHNIATTTTHLDTSCTFYHSLQSIIHVHSKACHMIFLEHGMHGIFCSYFVLPIFLLRFYQLSQSVFLWYLVFYWVFLIVCLFNCLSLFFLSCTSWRISIIKNNNKKNKTTKAIMWHSYNNCNMLQWP